MDTFSEKQEMPIFRTVCFRHGSHGCFTHVWFARLFHTRLVRTNANQGKSACWKPRLREISLRFKPEYREMTGPKFYTAEETAMFYPRIL